MAKFDSLDTSYSHIGNCNLCFRNVLNYETIAKFTSKFQCPFVTFYMQFLTRRYISSTPDHQDKPEKETAEPLEPELKLCSICVVFN